MRLFKYFKGACCVVACVSFIGCDNLFSDSSPDGQPQPTNPPVTNPTPSPTPSPSPPEKPAEERSVSVLPAEVTIFDLSDLNIQSDVQIDVASLPGGLVEGGAEAKIMDGSLRIVTGSDTGADERFTLRLVGSEQTDYSLTVEVRSQRKLAFLPVIEVEAETGADPGRQAPALMLTGLGPVNSFTDSDLTIWAEGEPEIDAKYSKFTLIDQQGRTTDLSNQLLQLSPTRLELPQSALAGFAEGTSGGDVDISVNIVDSDFELAELYTIRALVPRSSIDGQLIDRDGNPVALDRDVFISLIGTNSGIRRVVEADASGAFSFDLLIPETYSITVLDLEQPGVYSGFVPIFPDSTRVETTLLYDASQTQSGAAAPTGAMLPRIAAQSIAENLRPRVISRSRHIDPPDSARLGRSSLRQLAAAVPPAIAVGETGECANAEGDVTTYTVMSGAENATIQCAVAYAPPAGINSVTVEVSVASEEYPEYTQVNSEYDDQWRYSITSANATTNSNIAASSNVNASHRNVGEISEQYCVVGSAGDAGGEGAPLAISGAISSTNIGDSILATVVTVKFEPGCGDLVVERAEIETTNSGGERVVRPVNESFAGNLAGRYISIPGTAVASWGVPLIVEYTPEDAEISAVTLSLIQLGQTLETSNNLLSQATSVQPGRIEFRDLVMPTFAVAPIAGQVSLSVDLEGTIEDIVVETEEGLVNVSAEQSTVFYPLHLAEDTVSNADRRYGQFGAEAGDDNWARAAMVDWLADRSYRFNDISSLHIAQTATGRSVLGHAGHGDGMQVDLRYVDPDGGYSDFNDTALANLFTAAAAELGTPVDAARQRLGQWVNANRDAMDEESDAARRIYVANGVRGKALITGRMSDDSPIPGVDLEWSNAVVNSIQGHTAHWHISIQE